MKESGFNKIIKNLSEQKTSDEEFLSYENALEKADYLIGKYKNEIKANLWKDVDRLDNGEAHSDYQKSIEHFLEGKPRELLSHYYGHGVTKGSVQDRVAALLCIAANKSIKGDAAPLVRGDKVYISAYTNAEILVLSPKDVSIQPRVKKDGRDMSEPIFYSDRSWKANIGAIVVDVHYYPLVGEIQKMFPNVNIIKANQLEDYIK